MSSRRISGADRRRMRDRDQETDTRKTNNENPHTGSDSETADETATGRDAETRPPSWPLALTSVGICLGTGAAIALVSILA